MPFIDENEYTFLSSNHITPIHVREWVPECDINGVVQLCHGINEYIGRYESFARYLASKGFVVVGNDHLGHGKSVLTQDDLGFFSNRDGWDNVVDDVEKLRVLTMKKWPGVPYFMFGHSMGSFLLRTYIINYPASHITGAILSGTGQNPVPTVTAGILLCDTVKHREGARYRSDVVKNMMFGSYNKGFEPNRTPYDWLTRDEKIVDAYAADPLCTFTPTVGLVRDMLGGLLFISSPYNLSRMEKSLPVYFMSGEKDPVGADGKGVVKTYGMFLKAGMKDVFCKFYPDGRHEMLNELNRADVYRDVLDWIFGHINAKGF